MHDPEIYVPPGVGQFECQRGPYARTHITDIGSRCWSWKNVRIGLGAVIGCPNHSVKVERGTHSANRGVGVRWGLPVQLLEGLLGAHETPGIRRIATQSRADQSHFSPLSSVRHDSPEISKISDEQ